MARRVALGALLIVVGLGLGAKAADAVCCVCQATMNTCSVSSVSSSCDNCATVCANFGGTMLACCAGTSCQGQADSCGLLHGFCLQTSSERDGFCHGSCLGPLVTPTPPLSATPPAGTGHPVCGYKVWGAGGFLCPVHAGATVCQPVSAITGNDCRNPLLCSGGLFCQMKLTPYSGPATRCPFGSSRLRGFKCTAPVRIPTRLPTPTVTPAATPTATAGTSCPLAPGRYTVTYGEGGTLRVATFAPFVFPAGGTLVQDVSAGDANCVHSTVAPFPGGYDVPVFCVAALGATTQVAQTGCGIGRIDSNLGSDFTITEDGDTSETAACNVHQGTCPMTGPAPDSAGRLDVTVGDGLADLCPPGALGEAIVTVPVVTTTWVAFNGTCPDSDGSFDDNDMLLAQFPQTLDFTTDTNTARFTDIDGDGCGKSGIGPAGPFMSNGKCINFTDGSLTTGASGTIFSKSAPLFDILFTSQVPGTLSGPTAAGNGTCDAPPVIDFDGTATRCFTAF